MKALFNVILKWLSFLFGKEEESIVPPPTDTTDNSENATGETEPAVTAETESNLPNSETNNNDKDNEEVAEKNEEKYQDVTILLDNGHASTTPGKRSPVLPDGRQFREYEFSRDVVSRISKKLNVLGIRNIILVPETDIDVGLSKRAARANEYCDKYGAANCLFISVHANAAGNGVEWKNARGWSVYTTVGNTKSDKVATAFYEEAEKLLLPVGMTLRKDMKDGDPDYEENFTVIYKAKCPAILTENLFMDNLTDVQFLLSDSGRDIIADLHVNAIKRLYKKS